MLPGMRDRLRRWPRTRAGRRLLMALAVVGALLVIVRLVLDPIAAHYTRQVLNRGQGFRGAFSDVHVSILPPGYSIDRLKIIQHPDGQWDAPLFYAEKWHLSVLWRELLAGHLVGNIWVDAPKVRVPSRREKETIEKTKTIGERLEAMLPMRIDRVDIDRGEAVLVAGPAQKTDKKPAELWIHDAFLVAANLATRKALAKGQASHLRGRAQIQRSGDLRLSFDMDPWAKGLTFAGDASLQGLKLRDLHAFLEGRTDLHASQGTISVFAELRARNGELRGGVKPVLRNVEVESTNDDLGDQIKAALADVTIDLVEDDDRGDDRLATVIPIRGDVSDPEAQLVPTILGVIRNAFVTGLAAGFSGLPPPTSEEKENLFEQAWEALQEDEGQPQAQPEKEKSKKSREKKAASRSTGRPDARGLSPQPRVYTGLTDGRAGEGLALLEPRTHRKRGAKTVSTDPQTPSIEPQPTTYLYGDSTPSPLQSNYIEFLRDTVDFCVQILAVESRVHESKERTESLGRWATEEVERVEKVEAAVARALVPLSPTPDSAVGRCAQAILAAAAQAVRQEADNIRGQVAAQVGRMENQTAGEASACLKALEVLLAKHDLPHATSGQSLVLKDDGRYRCRLHMTTPMGLAADLAVEIPDGHLFSEPVRVDRLVERLEVQAPEVGGWLHREVKVRAHRLEKLYVTELRLGPDETVLGLRNGPRDQAQGFDIVFHDEGPAATLTTISDREAGPHGASFDLTGNDLEGLLVFRDKLRVAARSLEREGRTLMLATFDDVPLGHPEKLPDLVQRLVGVMAPVVQEIAARSSSPDEFVLRRHLGGDRREEIFLPKADLMRRLEPLPPERRVLFDPLWLDVSRAARAQLLPTATPPLSASGTPADARAGSPLSTSAGHRGNGHGTRIDGNGREYGERNRAHLPHERHEDRPEDERERQAVSGVLDDTDLRDWLSEPTR